MPGHYTYSGEFLKDYAKKLKNIKSFSPYLQEVLLMCVCNNTEVQQFIKKQEDIQFLTADFLINHIDYKFHLWETCPWLQYLSFEEFCEYVLPYRICHESVKDIPKTLFVNKDANETIITRYNDIHHSALGVSSLYSPQFFSQQIILPEPLNHISQLDCYMICLLQMFYYRASGVPAAIDFVPHWGNSDGRHYWASVIDAKFKRKIDDVLQNRKIPKIFRYTYSNKNELKDTNNIPELFRTPFIYDVTSEYLRTVQAEIEIPDSLKWIKYVYLTVFNEQKWNSVSYSLVDKRKAYFDNMGFGIVYLPIYYKGTIAKHISFPFILEPTGKKIFLLPNKKKLQTLCLKRKYHYNHLAMGGASMMGTTFECSNDSTFNNSVIFHKVVKNTHMDMQTIMCPSSSFKYWRIRPDLPCYLAELKFIDTLGISVNNKIATIYCDGKANLLFDDNPLTNIHSFGVFDFIFNQPIQLKEIKYLPVTDGNGIYPGNVYELLYFDKKGWTVHSTHKATSDSIIFRDVPSGALYWLRNLTTGKQERIFTSVKGKVNFW